MKIRHVASLLFGCFLLTRPEAFAGESPAPGSPRTGKVYIIPIQADIMPPLVYLVRRGVKEAMETKADALILDMKTDGGRVDVTEEIIEIISPSRPRKYSWPRKVLSVRPPPS